MAKRTAKSSDTEELMDLPDRAEQDAPPSGDKDARSGVQSLVRAFSILEEIGRMPDGISLAELSKAVGLHNSTAFHLVKTMVQLGYVHKDEETKRYRLGRPLFFLAAAVLDEVETNRIAAPILEELAAETGETSHYAVRSGDDVVIMARTEGGGAFRLSENAGATRPAHATAIGKVLLAAMTPEQFQRYLASAKLEPYTGATITDKARLAREIETVRRTGIAFDDAEFHNEVRCAAVPVYNFKRQVAGALGVSGPVWRLSLSSLQDLVPAVRAKADELSKALGHRPDVIGDDPEAGEPQQSAGGST